MQTQDMRELLSLYHTCEILISFLLTLTFKPRRCSAARKAKNDAGPIRTRRGDFSVSLLLKHLEPKIKKWPFLFSLH